MVNADRIRTQRHVVAMVALDTIDLIADRVRNLLAHQRRIAMTRRYTYLEQAPDLYAGLTVDTSARNSGIYVGESVDGKHFGVVLRPGIHGFGFSAYKSDRNTTEVEAWARFHAKQATSADYFERRRDMTEVTLDGGCDGDGPGRDDLIVIRAWNRDGVCEEQVIRFDCGDRHA